MASYRVGMGRGGRGLMWRVSRSILATRSWSILGIRRTRLPVIVPWPAKATFSALWTCSINSEKKSKRKRKCKRFLSIFCCYFNIFAIQHIQLFAIQLLVYLPVPTFWCVGRKTWSPSLCYCRQWQEAFQWHPGSKGQEGLHLLWSKWGAAPTRNLYKQGQTFFSPCILERKSLTRAGLSELLPPRTFSCVVLQQQFLPSPLNAAQHIETVAEAGSQGNVVGQRHGESKVREWQRGHKPGWWVTFNPEGFKVKWAVEQQPAAQWQTSRCPPRARIAPRQCTGLCWSLEPPVSPGTSLPQRRYSRHRPQRWSASCAVNRPRVMLSFWRSEFGVSGLIENCLVLVIISL